MKPILCMLKGKPKLAWNLRTLQENKVYLMVWVEKKHFGISHSIIVNGWKFEKKNSLIVGFQYEWSAGLYCRGNCETLKGL